MMNILHLSSYFPSTKATHAGGVCMGWEIEELRKKHNVYVLSFCSKDDEKLFQAYPEPDKCARVKVSTKKRLFNALLHPWISPMFATRRCKEFESLIKEFLVKYHIDAVHAEYAAMGQYIDLIHKVKPTIPCNLILHDVTYQNYIRKEQTLGGLKKVLFRIITNMVKRDEMRYVASAANTLVFCEKDAELVQSLYHKPAIAINTFFDIETALKKGAERKYDSIPPYKICFFGQMGREENHVAAMRLLDIVAGISNITTLIIGSYPLPELVKRQQKNVVITGFVDDPDQLLESCDLAVFPLTLGAGIKIKVLHCMALGIPVISTKVGAEGIDETGKAICIAETNQEFASAIEQCIGDSNKFRDMGRKEMDLIKENFSWKKTQMILNSLYQ